MGQELYMLGKNTHTHTHNTSMILILAIEEVTVSTLGYREIGAGLNR